MKTTIKIVQNVRKSEKRGTKTFLSLNRKRRRLDQGSSNRTAGPATDLGV